jgi:predicted ribosomally synthesized peptide with SipW-like signal peptide
MVELDTALTERRRRRRRRGLVVLLLTLAIASLGAGAFSLALFTDQDATTGSFSTGTIDINVDNPALFSVSGIMPGDSGSATLNVTNGGSAQLRYAMDSASTDTDGKGLRTVLNMAVVEGACPGTGATLSSGPLWTSLVVHSKFGSTAPGPQANDRILNSGQSEAFCFAWDLPIGTTSAYQGATTTATFTFYAEQTAHNP